MSSDGRTVVTASRDRTARRWTMADGAPLAPVLTGHSDQIRVVVISSDGSRVATASQDRTVRLWGAEPAPPI